MALELAAARIQVLSPSQLASRLADRFRLLTGRERVVVPRQQTLRATLDWSYELLSPVEQHALACLAVFPDTFDLEAAEAVISDGPGDVSFDDALDLLCRLVDKSLVVVHSEGATPRYRLLETVRQYGTEKLAEAGQEAAARRRHRDTFLARVQAWRGMPVGAEFLWGAFTDADNFRAALEWSWAQRDADAVLHLIGALWVPWLWFGNPDSQIWVQRTTLEPEFSAPELANHPARVDALALLAIFFPEMPEMIGSGAMSCSSKPLSWPAGSVTTAVWPSIAGHMASTSYRWAKALRHAHCCRRRLMGLSVWACPTEPGGATTTSAGPPFSRGTATGLETTR